jgi:hypothetical protein
MARAVNPSISIAGTGGGGATNSEEISQVAHGFAKYDAISFDGTTYVKSQADVAANADTVGIVSAVAGADNFTITYSGIIAWNTPGTPDLASGADLWLSPTTAGLVVATEPTYSIGNVRQYVGESLASGFLVNIDIGEEIDNTEPAVQINSRGRLVKFLTTSGTLTINDDADDSVEAYLTSNEIKSGAYLVYAYGAGGGGGSGTTSSGFNFGAAGGGAGGVSRGIFTIDSSTVYAIGAGGAGGTSGADGSSGGNTTILTLTAGGGDGGKSGGTGGGGGTGNYQGGGDGGAGNITNSTSVIARGGTGGGLYSSSTSGGVAGLNSGGGGGPRTTSSQPGSNGGDGYIEIYEWEV